MGSIIVTCFFLTWIIMGIMVDRIEDPQKRTKIAWSYTWLAVFTALLVLFLS